MINKIDGSIDTLNSLQITSDVKGLDASSKELFRNKEILAVILKGVVEEYKDYSYQEIMNFIEADSITSDEEVSTGRTNTRIKGDNVEFTQLNEKTSNFDIYFTSKNPLLSTKVLVRLHIDIEPQKDYKPGYPIEKRGLYYLSRSLSSQLSVVTDKTDYNSLEKCYSIWICRDNIPKKERYSISFYNMENSKNIGMCYSKKENYDLLSMVIIRLGSEEAPKKEGVLEFLNAIFYPHKKDFFETVKKYIDFSNNKELTEEVSRMSGLGMSILEEGMEKGIQQGLQQGKSKQIVVNVTNLMKSLDLSLEDACRALNIEVSEYENAKKMIE